MLSGPPSDPLEQPTVTGLLPKQTTSQEGVILSGPNTSQGYEELQEGQDDGNQPQMK